MKKTLPGIFLISALLASCLKPVHAEAESRRSLLLMWWNVEPQC